MTRGKGRERTTVFSMISLAGLLMVLAPAMAYAQSAMSVGQRHVGRGYSRRDRRSLERRSDREGQVGSHGWRWAYRISDLRPGTYVVTFMLPGFKTFRRDVRIAAEFTATINAELGVGSLEETITVTGASPVVDVTSAAKTSVLNREAMDLIPTGRSIQGMAQLVVGVSLSLPDTGGARAMQQTYMSTHGMSTSNTTVLVDGQMTNGLQTDGAVQSYYNDAMNAEMSYQTAAIGAETSSGGVRLNMIPREGGNQLHGDFKMAQRPGSWQSSNLTDRHIGQGPDRRQRHRPHPRLHGVARRPDHEGQAVVLHRRRVTSR